MCLRCAVQQNLILALHQHVETVNKYLTSERNARAARELREEINFAEGWVGSHGNKQTRGLLGLSCRFAPRVTQACSSCRLSSPHGDFPLSGATAALDLWGMVHHKITCPGECSVLHEDVLFPVV
uniref:Uncharacterized protein n=1 Tax=Myotis myotis TaxID=51298 RepID=A0A7J7TJA4_MYOMY|nr:hypothetical protein mMyoMyo1_009085 [Myotis myotis]